MGTATILSDSLILQGNHILAEFMGAVYSPTLKCWKDSKSSMRDRLDNCDALQFHSCYNWLHAAWNEFRYLEIPTWMFLEYTEWVHRIIRALAWESNERCFAIIALAVEWYQQKKGDQA